MARLTEKTASALWEVASFAQADGDSMTGYPDDRERKEKIERGCEYIRQKLWREYCLRG